MATNDQSTACSNDETQSKISGYPGGVWSYVSTTEKATKPPVSTSQSSTWYVEHRIGDRTHCVDHPRIVFVLKLLFLNFGVRILNTLSDVGYFTYFVAYI